MADTDILSITRSLKRSRTSTQDATQKVFSAYLDIIEDIEIAILEGLQDSRFEEPQLVASITANFIEEIARDISNQPESRFLNLIEKFASKNSVSGQQKNSSLGLWALFDLLINYMAELEDHVRANAMARCGRFNLSRNDKAQIVSSMVLAIYPYCKTITFPKNVVGVTVEKILGGIIKYGIRYECMKHLNKSISIYRKMQSEKSHRE